MSFKQRIIEAMEKAQLKQSDLARFAKVSRATVSLWVKGETKSISGDSLTRVARVLNVDPHWLSTGERRSAESFRVSESAATYNNNEQRLLQSFRSMGESDQARAIAILNALVKVASERTRR